MNYRMQNLVTAMQMHPLARWLVWLGFAALFFRSGLSATTWLLAREQFAGGADWVWLALFPVLLPLFFVVNGRFGCAGGSCSVARRPDGYRFPPGN
jgi:hypothetical protein